MAPIKGTTPWNKGIPMSDSQKQKLSLAKTGQKYPNRKKPPAVTDAHKKHLSESLVGKKYPYRKRSPCSPATKEKIAARARGRVVSLATREKLSKIFAGKPFIISPETRIKMRENQQTLEYREMISRGMKKAMKEGRHPGWKGGITPKNQAIRSSFKMELWRKKVFKRDNYTCQDCSARNGNGKRVVLHADHIKRFSDYPKLRFTISNGRTLCVPCHKKTDTWGNKKQKPIESLQALA